jgi:glucose/arabinose dehydrogenase
LNFGWSFYEALHPYQDQPPTNATLTLPVFEYSHSEGCSVTGGYVYRGQVLPEWQGVYFWGDYCSGNIWGLVHPAGNSQKAKILFKTGAQITTFGVDQAGEIYLADYKSGSVLRLVRKQ